MTTVYESATLTLILMKFYLIVLLCIPFSSKLVISELPSHLILTPANQFSHDNMGSSGAVGREIKVPECVLLETSRSEAGSSKRGSC